jgi:hypothetical protein
MAPEALADALPELAVYVEAADDLIERLIYAEHNPKLRETWGNAGKAGEALICF